MQRLQRVSVLIVMTCLISVGVHAGTYVNTNIVGPVPVVWTEQNSPYHLEGQIYVEPGATLIVEPNVVVASFVADGGSLAVCRGAQIFVNGTKEKPVIMTSAEDVATWDGSVVTRDDGSVNTIVKLGNPRTGQWRMACNEWGNLTILGQGLIAATGTLQGGNPYPDGTNEAPMEGLVEEYPGDMRPYYGGDNDLDDSGLIRYLSIRYGGKVIGLSNELSGLALGGVGRETDIDHVEVMNGVDDGIEVWGGTVSLKYVNIWNVGDDSFDMTQGWRGCMQYGLIVQGYSCDDVQGSGVGDNCFETDRWSGVEPPSQYPQPYITSRIANFTVIGQPVDGDHATVWGMCARLQYHNCIFMDIGHKLIDYASGYGLHGHPITPLSWTETWNTSYAVWITMTESLCYLDPAFPWPPDISPNRFQLLENIYGRFLCGSPDDNLAQIRDTCFYNNPHSEAYMETDNLGVTILGGDSPGMCNYAGDFMTWNMPPIQAITRAAPVMVGGKTMLRVTYLNPCAACCAVTSYVKDNCNCKQSDDFYQPAPFRGGFSPYYNWLESWTAVDAYGMTDTGMNTPTDTTSAILPDDGDLDNDMDTDLYDWAKFARSWLDRK